MHTSWTLSQKSLSCQYLQYRNNLAPGITGINTAKVGTKPVTLNWSPVLSAIFWKYIEILLWPLHHWIMTKASLVQYNMYYRQIIKTLPLSKPESFQCSDFTLIFNVCRCTCMNTIDYKERETLFQLIHLLTTKLS